MSETGKRLIASAAEALEMTKAWPDKRENAMTTEYAAAQYLAEHLQACAGKGYAVYNPQDIPLDELPVVYGFNNGGSPGWFEGVLLAQDGTFLGGHICSHEGYMPSDLGIREGFRSDRHETFMTHYPNGYRMDFVSYDDVSKHEGLLAAITANKRQKEGCDE